MNNKQENNSTSTTQKNSKAQAQSLTSNDKNTAVIYQHHKVHTATNFPNELSINCFVLGYN